MTRRSMTHVLLALLLLVSQQFAIAHVVSHLGGRIASAPGLQVASEDDGLSQAIAQHKACGECLAFAQFASAIGPGTRSFVPPETASSAVARAAGQGSTARTIWAFRSRAPPSVV